MKKMKKLFVVLLALAMIFPACAFSAFAADDVSTIVSESYVDGWGNMTDKFVITSTVDLSNVAVEDIVLEKAYVHPYIMTESKGALAVSYADGKLTIDVDDFCVYRSPDMTLTINGKDGQPILTFAHSDLTYNNPDIDQFSEGQTESGVMYRLYSPDATGALPIIIHLHGNGQQGNDNLLPLLADNSGVALASEVVQGIQACYALVPQCPADSSWTAEILGEILAVVDQLVAEGKVDPSRIYLTGHSMGSFGVFTAIANYPGKFAAVIPFAGGVSYTAEEAKAVAESGVSIWIVHAADDFILPVESSRTAYETLKAAGADVRYTELDASLGYNHGANLLMATDYTPDDGGDSLYTWLFKQGGKKEETTYTVVKGDCLWNLAKKFYGTGSKWKVIYEANQDIIKNPNRIYIGQKLVIPAP